MTTKPSPTAAMSCAEKTRLMQEVLEVHKRIASIQIEKMEAVLRGSYERDLSFQSQLKDARELRHQLMNELRQHIVDHRC